MTDQALACSPHSLVDSTPGALELQGTLLWIHFAETVTEAQRGSVTCQGQSGDQSSDPGLSSPPFSVATFGS